jgi:hypothetical protein
MRLDILRISSAKRKRLITAPGILQITTEISNHQWYLKLHDKLMDVSGGIREEFLFG